MTPPLPTETGATSRHVQVDGTVVHVHEAGSGPTLLCIHGGAPGATGWANFGQNVATWARGFRVLVVDLPGFGESDWVEASDGKHRAHANLFVGLLDELGISGPVHVVALATGGAVAMRMAIDHPDRVARLVLVSSAGGLSLFDASPTEGERAIREYYSGTGPSLEKMRHYLALTVSDPALVTDELVEARHQNSITPQALEGSRHRGRPHPSDAVWQEAPSIRARTLIVWGRDNRVKGYDNGLFLLNRIPDSELHIYSGAGLWVPFERAARFERLVSDFLLAD
ncbi:alpha/beta fold hydrolase [Streptomyces sp. NPDC001812]|uniref:alpha/beta fold hydrolase n=1 Tax=unclassified Streptomyces TaxID=2593676 RepID=UPI00365BAEDC